MKELEDKKLLHLKVQLQHQYIYIYKFNTEPEMQQVHVTGVIRDSKEMSYIIYLLLD